METKRLSPLDWVKQHTDLLACFGGFVFCVILFTVLTPMFGESIWSATKLRTILVNAIVLALLSVGAVFIYSLGCMDVSVGAQVCLYATLMVLISNVTNSLIVSVLVCMALSVVVSTINGATSVLLHIPSTISSVVLNMVIGAVNGIVFNSLGSRNVVLQTVDNSLFRTSWFMVVALVLEFLVVGYLLNYTKYGKYARAIGANAVSAEQCGISLVKYRVISYIIFGFCVVIASLFQMGYTGSSSDSLGAGYAMNIIIALVLGGMPLSGGMRSRLSSAVVGAFTVAILSAGLPMIGIDPNMVNLFKSVLFLAIVLVTSRKQGGILPS